jgi:thiol-disulfide isomerase/thioredoxin
MGRSFRFWFPFIVFQALLVLAPAAGVRAEVKVGDRLPPISGRNLNGDTLQVEELTKGSVSLVAFWSVYCKPCVKEISSLVQLSEKYRGRLVVVGINTDGELPPARIRTFVERYEEFEKRKISYPIIFDENNRISKQLGVGYLPTVMALDSEGKVSNLFVGFDEKDEQEILAGIERMLPMAGQVIAEEAAVFDVQLQVPLCGFYDENGWRESFDGNTDIRKEQDKLASYARELAVKTSLKRGLERLGITPFENQGSLECMSATGVLLRQDPWKERDSLTNLANALNFRKYVKVLETEERLLATEYCLRQKISVNLLDLKDDVERAGVSLKPGSISFVVINMDAMLRMIFEEAVRTQSRFIGRTSFPAYTIYTTQENFINELQKLDYGGTRIFVNDAGAGVVEVEAWR